MKAAFRILPADKEIKDAHLLVEAGAESISFVIFEKSPFIIHSLLVYNLAKDILPAEIAAEIDKILSNEPVLTHSFKSCTVCSNFDKSILVPGKYPAFTAGNDMLDLIYGPGVDTSFYIDPIEEKDISNIYRIENAVVKELGKHYNNAVYFHSTSLQLKKQDAEPTSLSCIIYHTAIKVILYKDGKLQLVQYFSYNIALDIIYHLLNVCERHTISPEQVNVLLSGMIDERSNLYSEIYKYFLNIRFDELPANAQPGNEILQYPAHFFSHIIYLASCVS